MVLGGLHAYTAFGVIVTYSFFFPKFGKTTIKQTASNNTLNKLPQNLQIKIK